MPRRGERVKSMECHLGTPQGQCDTVTGLQMDGREQSGSKRWFPHFPTLFEAKRVCPGKLHLKKGFEMS